MERNGERQTHRSIHGHSKRLIGTDLSWLVTLSQVIFSFFPTAVAKASSKRFSSAQPSFNCRASDYETSS